MRIHRSARKVALVAAVVAVLLSAAPASAGFYTYGSFARDNSYRSIDGSGLYNGVYSDIYYQPTNQTSGINCYQLNNVGANPVYDQIKIGRGTGDDYLFSRIVDQCGGYSWFEFGYKQSGGAEQILWSQQGPGAGFHTLAIWRPYTPGLLGGNGGNNTFHYAVDNIERGTIGSGSKYSFVDVGMESHADEPQQTILRQSFENIQIYSFGGPSWGPIWGQDYAYASIQLCGRWAGDTNWFAGTGTYCT